MNSFPDYLLYSKERIIYELAISLSVDPDDLSYIDPPDSEDPKHNIYVALIENIKILEKMKKEA